MADFLTSAELRQKEPGAGVHPLKFLLWLLIISSSMSFAAFTSGYIVRKGEGNWLEFNLPSQMMVSALIIILSSLTMQWAYFATKRDNLKQAQLGLGLTLGLGFVFLWSQMKAWSQLVAAHVFFGGATANPAGSFVYVLSGFHGFHIVCALIFVFSVLLMALRYRVHSKAMLWMELCTIFWHFLGGLWLYLHLFLILNR